MEATLKLSDRERAVLVAMADGLPEDYCWPFDRIRHEVEQTGNGCEPGNIRRVVRSLARKGMTYFQRGLFTEDGELAGSGYGVTDAGRKWFWNSIAAPAKEPV